MVTSQPRSVDDYMQLPYRMEVYRDGTSWVAESPELPGLVAEHETWEGLQGAISDAKRAYFEAAIRQRRAIPLPVRRPRPPRATRRREPNRALRTESRPQSQPPATVHHEDDWMWEEGLPDLVDRGGQTWLRLRKWEKGPDMRAWMTVPPDYEYHEEDQDYFALEVQISVWRKIAPILLRDQQWPAELDNLPDQLYPEAAKRRRQSTHYPDAYYQVRMVSRSPAPGARSRGKVGKAD